MSPLRWFRRHATWMLIIFGVVLMAIFGLGPVFDQMANGFQSAATAVEDPVIIKYREGEITRTRLDELQRNHFATRRFLVSLVEQAAKQCEQKEVQFSPMADMVQPLGRTDDNDAVDEQMLVRKLLAERAEDEGVVISDGMIEDYLSLLAGQAEFTPRDWKQINKLVNQRTAMPSIRKHLKLELLAMQMQRYTSAGVPLNPIPTEAVELYARANDRMECEVVPVSVEEYVSKVSEQPGNAELQALFEEGKYDYEDVGMLTPGFKVPRKVNIQYFVAEMDTFLQNEKSKLTDAEVEAEYEKLVEAEDPLVVEVVAQPETEGFKLDLGDDEKPADEPAKEATTPAVDAVGAPAVEGASATEPAESSATEVPATEVPATEVPATEVPATEVPATEVPATEVPATEVPTTDVPETEGGGSDQSLIVRQTKSQFASFVQDAQEETPATNQEEVGGLGDLQLSDESAGPQSGETTKKTRIKPLSEVADKIRERLARKAAFEKKDEAKKRAMVAMQTYQNQVLRWDTQREADKAKTPKPPVPDFEAIAKENGLVFRETGLIDPFELRDTEIGKVNFPVQVQSPEGPVRMDFQSVSNRIFLDYDRVDVLIPQEVSDIMTANAYVYWMAEKVDVRIPEFDEAKPKIEKYWKYQQAIELAKKAAEDMATKARSAGKKLTELYPETAAPTGEFTWFRPGRTATAVYGMPFGIEQPGEEFMQTAFGLKEGETAVAANKTRDTIYVIQRTTPPVSMADLGSEYLDSQFFRFKRVPTDVMGAAQHYAQELEFDWRDEFVEAMKLKRMK